MRRLVLSLFLAATCGGAVIAAPAMAPMAGATLMTGTGAPAGKAMLMQTKSGLHLTVDVSWLPAGEHGVHIHAVGMCDGPDFKTAGGHWNPMHKMHGKDAPGGAGPHMGDLPNLTVGADGTGHLDTMIPGATLMGGDMAVLDADGASVVVHAAADDYKTDPSGNSGARLACGVLKAS
jgi:superoxide dismutase, Cu-Zn family